MYVVDEDNGLVQIELIFSNPSSLDITVQVMATDATAVGVNNTDCVVISSENDYTIGLYNVTFPANVTSRVIDIPICDDIVLEEDEEFNVSIISNSSPDDVINGTIDQSTIIIVDNDGEYYIYYTYNIMYLPCYFIAIMISFDELIYHVDESNGTVELMVTLSIPSSADITVQVVSNDITATSKFIHKSIIYAVPYSTTQCTTLHFTISMPHNIQLP